MFDAFIQAGDSIQQRTKEGNADDSLSKPADRTSDPARPQGMLPMATGASAVRPAIRQQKYNKTCMTAQLPALRLCELKSHFR